MLVAIEECPVPVIAAVRGAALGGGMALCCVADITLATADTSFGFTEVKLGLMPAVISPFVLPRIGEGNASRMTRVRATWTTCPKERSQTTDRRLRPTLPTSRP